MFHVRLNPVLCLMISIFVVGCAVSSAYAGDLFGYELDAGSGKIGSLLKSQGYDVVIKTELTYISLSFVELFGYSNEYFKDMQLWGGFYKHRSYAYKWQGIVNADKDVAVGLDSLMQYIVKAFGEPKDLLGNNVELKSINTTSLNDVAVAFGDEDLSFIWKKDDEQIEMFLSAPLLAMSDTEIEFTLRYSSLKKEKEVRAYRGEE